MNKEIRSRGKPIDKQFGEWVEGFYLEDLDKGQIKYYIFDCPLHIEVDPKTIGQFTGVKDKNGVRIYEGDIVEYSRGMVASVEWVNDGRFLGFTPNRRILYLDSRPQVEVIGNIYDNPDLLK